MPTPLRRRMRRLGVLFGLALSSCVPPGSVSRLPPPPWTVPQGAGPAFTAIRYDQMPGWESDHAGDALLTFLASCAQMRTNPAQALGGSGEAAALGGTAAQWTAVCAAAEVVPANDDAAARKFFEANLQPYGVSADGSAAGLFTAYYEPEVAGSRIPDATYKYPLYRRPPGLVPGAVLPTRADIERGALRGKRLELLWLADPVDVFFLQVQGAGRVRLPDGHIVRVTYDGQNGQPYVPIGRVLVDWHEMTLDRVSMQSIRGWLAAHPDRATELMDQNTSYVFFRELNGYGADMGPPGTLGAPLTPMRSIAVDKAFVPLGAPVWIDTKDSLDGKPIQRLMAAQDLGGAIRGPVRADIFFGWGADAEAHAGKMRQQGTEVVLLPKQKN
jgi:membrane-bound lytic murein transglycosylase A